MKLKSLTHGLVLAASLMMLPYSTFAQQSDQDSQAQELEAWIADMAKPGEHHAVLDVLIGEWDGTIRVWDEPGGDPVTVDVKVSRQWILGNRFVQETVTAGSGNEQYNGLGYIGYNNVDRHYVMHWMDDQSTTVQSEIGRYNRNTKILSTRGSSRDPSTGFVILERSQLDLSDPDRHTIVVFTTDETGVETRAAEGELKRRQ